MGTFSIWHWLIVLAVVLLLFGRGKIPGLARDLGQGINAFKRGLKESKGEDAEADAGKISAERETESAQSQTEGDKVAKG